MPPPAQSKSGSATWRIVTPTGAAGGVAVIQLLGDLEAVFAAMNMAPVGIGGLALRSFFGVDAGVVARWTASFGQLMPHAGPGVVRLIAERLSAAGFSEAAAIGPRELYPEARDELEAKMLAALARAASPLAIDVLLDQPRRWREHAAGGPGPDDRHSKTLARLLDPPLVVMIGPSNIGKSTLTNALAGSAVSIVADEPGTTRDHVGVMIDMAGLVVRFVDTPGLRAQAGPIEAEATALAREVAARADLVLLAGDVTAPPIRPAKPFPSVLVVRTRADLGPVAWPHDLAVGAWDQPSRAGLVAAIRDRLVPPEVLADPRPWSPEFW